MKLLRLLLLALAAATPLPALAQQQANPELEVRGSLSQPSDWREAETDHVLVYSNGSESELKRIAYNLERLHFLLSVLLGRYGQPENAAKLRVTLVGDTTEFNAMNLRNLRSSQGPFARAFPVQRYYDPREDGAVMANTRIDQQITLERGQSLASLSVVTLDPATGLLESNLFGLSSQPELGVVNQIAVPVSAEGRLYAGYAQHYLLTYFPNAYPRWYLDGFGEIFATFRVRGDGAVEYGRPPEGYGQVTGWLRGYPVRDVIEGKYLAPKRNTQWTPYHAWAIVHYLFFSEARSGQLRAYLAAYAAGKSPEQAALAFGSMAKLQSDVTRYDNSKVPYERLTYPSEIVSEPVVRQLTRGREIFIKGRLELGSRVELPPAPGTGVDFDTARRMAKARDAAIAARGRWLDRLRSDAARYSASLEAQLLLTEAECRSGNPAECTAAADRALALEPDSASALAWKGMALLQRALAGPESERAAGIRAARGLIAKANALDNDAVLPLIAYFRSFVDAGEAAPDVALEGMLKTIDTVPAAPGPRLMLGREFVRDGNGVAARRTLLPVARGPYETPEQAEAGALIGVGGKP